MRGRWGDGDEQRPVFWPAVADVFIGFLALVLLASVVAYQAAHGRKGKQPPPAKQSFSQQFREAFGEGLGLDEHPRVADTGFSELKIYFPAAFLFDKCRVDLKQSGDLELRHLKRLFLRFDDRISRVVVTGHTDTDRPTEQDRVCWDQGIHSNWELSALRALTVLELLAPDDRSGLDPHKVWASALGEYHPVAAGSSEAAKAKNRRIEIVVRFIEP